jgi:uncharacterized protein (TIGR03086 family)
MTTDDSAASASNPLSDQLSDPANRFDHHAQRFDDLIRAVPSERWNAATPCAGWTVTDVVSHVVETQRDLLGRMGFDQPVIDGLDPLHAWPVIRTAMTAALHDPEHSSHRYEGFFGPTTFAATVDQFYTFDLAIHRWDIARAAGMPEHETIEPDEIDRIRRDAAGFGDAMRMPGVIGPEVTAPTDASDQERLLAWLGRDPRQ